MSRSRIWIKALVAALCLSGVVSLAAAAGSPTVITAEFVDDVEPPGNNDFWSIHYFLADDFQYDWGHGITVWFPLETAYVMTFKLRPADCGWSFSWLPADSALLADNGLDNLSASEPDCLLEPGRELFGFQIQIPQGTAP
ncbi:MAG: hypothetical protein JRH19_10885, partial [Deltaproteobacteria bacterium]|nr:hypothetical protein [Deltaproteobacteria bacterium]